MRTPIVRADEHLRWLKANGHDLAPLTGTDRKVLAAVDACWALYSYTRSDGVLAAVDQLLHEMQPKCWPLARELIARSMDWDDREPVWLSLPSVGELGELGRVRS